MISNHLKLFDLPLSSIKPPKRQLRKYGKHQIDKAVQLITETGVPPIVIIDDNNVVIAGNFVVEAAKRMGLETIPVIRIDGMTPEAGRVLALALDRLRDEERWIKDAVAAEFKELSIAFPELDLQLTGFEIAEIDGFLDFSVVDPVEAAPEPDAGMPAVTKPGDLWTLGDHRLICGDALNADTYACLMGKEKADMVLTDPPYNVPIDGHVSGLGQHKHREFAQAAGEMTQEEFTAFLSTVFGLMVAYARSGSIHTVFMDWRHILEITSAANTAGYEHKNLCVWVKDNGGMGSMYRSRHELAFVFKAGDDPHMNNVQLGRYGRYRTNVWEYAGVNSFGGQQGDLAMHPTVKPVPMLVDAIKDCTKRGDIVLDPFGGSGSTLVAAERCKRRARLIEIDPLYCDVIVRRWQALTGKDAVHADTNQTFNENVKGNTDNV